MELREKYKIIYPRNILPASQFPVLNLVIIYW